MKIHEYQGKEIFRSFNIPVPIGYAVNKLDDVEKVIKKAAELKLNATPEMHNEYHASRASVLAAEYALKEMSS